jgi:hypothetical protein
MKTVLLRRPLKKGKMKPHIIIKNVSLLLSYNQLAKKRRNKNWSEEFNRLKIIYYQLPAKQIVDGDFSIRTTAGLLAWDSLKKGHHRELSGRVEGKSEGKKVIMKYQK